MGDRKQQVRLLLISSSNVHGYGYLDHAEPEIKSFLGNLKHVGFVPLALQDRAGYTAKVAERLARMGFRVTNDVEGADAIFVGGGNTFRLLKALYETGLLDRIRSRVLSGTPYMGSSAGSNIAAPTIRTTNDMPIVQPPSFDALNLVPYQINPHYLDADASSTHMGETREQRLKEFHEENDVPVVAIREGTMLRVENGVTKVVGSRNARVLKRGEEAVEVEPGGVIRL
jgi:dipeptidase E